MGEFKRERVELVEKWAETSPSEVFFKFQPFFQPLFLGLVYGFCVFGIIYVHCCCNQERTSTAVERRSGSGLAKPSKPSSWQDTNRAEREMEATIGDLFEVPGEMRGEWHIPNFLSLPHEAGKWFCSPKFIFLDCCWCLTIYPGGLARRKSDGGIGLYLRRLNCDSPVTVNFSIIVRTAEKEEKKESRDHTFTNEQFDWGWIPFLKRSELQRRLKRSPSDDLVVAYTLEKGDQTLFESTLCSRLWTMSMRYNSTLTSQKRTDVVLKLQDGEIPAHRAILESSSEVFARMFDVDMQESQTGEVNIEDSTLGIFQVVLTFIYSGDLEGLSCENVCEVYKVAHKYELQDLRKMCTKFMKRTLCVDTVCDVIALADLYQETALVQVAKDYFAKNKSDVFKSEKWKAFRKDNPEIACQVLECVLA